jgi:hypothetical protein
MVRLKAPDYLSKEKVPPRKDFIYYRETWGGLDWKGIPLSPVVDHVEGMWQKQFTKPHYNSKTGQLDYDELDVGKAQTIYTIPFSKAKVDQIIAKCTLR